MSENLALPPHERCQQSKLDRRQMNGLTPLGYLVGRHIHPNVAKAYHGRCRLIGIKKHSATELGAHTPPEVTLPSVLPYDIGWFASADVGHWFLGTTDGFYGNIKLPNYTNWDLGVAFTWNQFTLDLRYFDTNLSKGDCNAFTGDQAATGMSNVTAINTNGAGSNWCGAAVIAKLSVDLTAANLK
jgi:hypothetical protein